MSDFDHYHKAILPDAGLGLRAADWNDHLDTSDRADFSLDNVLGEFGFEPMEVDE